MFCFSEKTVAVTNRHLAGNDFFNRIDFLCRSSVKSIILREKDLPENEYFFLAQKVLAIGEKYGKKIILHNFAGVAEKLKCRYIHLPFSVFKETFPEKADFFDERGTSVHSVKEALEAEKLGATYVTFGHVFSTECKKDLEPRGLNCLKEVCNSVKIPVFAIGGITEENLNSVFEYGADAACVMSLAMVQK